MKVVESQQQPTRLVDNPLDFDGRHETHSAGFGKSYQGRAYLLIWGRTGSKANPIK